jgi:hypothetical protein
MQNHHISKDTVVYTAIMVIAFSVLAVVAYLTLSGKLNS